MFTWIASPEAWVSLFTLTVLEIILGIDNIIFISILVNKLPEKLRNKTRLIGLGGAMLIRVLLLLSISWVMTLVTPLFSMFSEEISGRDLILLIGGLFLIAKSTNELHDNISLEHENHDENNQKAPSFFMTLLQIIMLDVIFSLDSVITAVGMADHIEVMIIAIIIGIGIMMLAAKFISEFIEKNPTFKILALSFLILIGMSLLAEGLDLHIPKGYIYFSVTFGLLIEILNMKRRKKARLLNLTKQKNSKI